MLLIPAAPDDPLPVRMRRRIGRDARLGFGEAPGHRQVERHGRQPHAHHVDVGIDKAGHQHPALAIDGIVRAGGALVTPVEHLHDPAIVADDKAGQPLDIALLVKGKAIDIVDQRIGKGGAGGEQREGCERTPHLRFPGSGRRLTSALVSSRPPPMACTSA